jgi:hypothetical protein
MPSLVDIGMSSLDYITSEINRDANSLETVASPLREAFLKKGLIKNISDFTTDEHNRRTSVTVDGAMVVQSLASSDLVQVGAVAAEGTLGGKIFEDDGPAEFFQCLIEHDNKVSTYANSLMCLQELVMMQDKSISHDLRIIDGAWNPALISVMMSFTRTKEGASLLNRYMIKMLEEEKWDGDELIEAISRRISPWDYTDESKHGRLAAISKSDSSVKFDASVRKMLLEVGIDVPKGPKMHDRTIASMVLLPGEFLVPQPMIIDHSLLMAMSQSDNGGKTGPWTSKNLTEMLGLKVLKERFGNNPYSEVIEEMMHIIFLGDGKKSSAYESLTRTSDEEWLWNTYFKPSTSGEYNRAMKVDIARPPHTAYSGQDFAEEMEQRLDQVVKHVGDTVSMINVDTLNEAQEPMSQYNADKRAKDISRIATFTRHHLLEALDNPRTLAGLVRGYRT